MIEREFIKFISGTPIAIRTYNIDKYEPHYHDDCIELLFVLNGAVNIRANYDRFYMTKNDFTIINRGDIHYIRGDKDNMVVSLYINLKAFEEKYEYVRYIYFLCESFNANSVQKKYNPEVRKLFTDIVLETAEEKKDIHKIWQLMDIFISKYDFAHYHNGREIPDNQLQRYYRIIKEIETNYGEKLDLDYFAQKEFVGKNYISQFWKKITNMNLTDYINAIRTEKSEKMMLTGEKSVNEVSFKCGFSDPKYIYKGFRKWYEKTPSQHKREYKRYKEEGTSVDEYGIGEFIVKFGHDLVYADMDEIKVSLIQGEGAKDNWKRKYEAEVRKYSGSRMKQELIKESHRESGIREVYLPLFDRSVTDVSGEYVTFDKKFIEKVLVKVKELAQTLFIEMRFRERASDEWEKIIRGFSQIAKDIGSPDLLAMCRFVVCLDEFGADIEAKEFIDRISDIVNRKHIKIALKFD